MSADQTPLADLLTPPMRHVKQRVGWILQQSFVSNLQTSALCRDLASLIATCLSMTWLTSMTLCTHLQSSYNRSTQLSSRFIPSASFLSRFSSSSTCQPISVIIPALIIHHSCTLLLQAQNLPFQQILPTLDFFYLLVLDCLVPS